LIPRTLESTVCGERFLHKNAFWGGFEMAPFLILSNSDKPIFWLFRRSHLAAVQIPPHYLPQSVEVGNMLET